MWSFGDGSAPVTADSPTTIHTFNSGETYHVAHFASNSGGASGTSQDVAVITKLLIQASSFIGSPATTTLKVGRSYEITFETNPAQPNVHHGVAGLAVLGVPADCTFLNPSCVWTVTPTLAQATSNGGVYPYGCAQTSCGSGHANMQQGGPSGGTITITP